MGGTDAWFCYMVRCKDDSLYVGIATNVNKRVQKHNWGVGPRYTAIRRPVQVIWSEFCGTAEAARKREKQIKHWPREKKLALARAVGIAKE